MIDFVQAGGKRNTTAADGDFNLNLLHTLLANNKVDNEGFVNTYGSVNESATGGPRIYFPPGRYYFSGPIRLRNACHLVGSDAATRAAHNTIFIFPKNTQGLIADSYNTDNYALLAPGTASANGFAVEGIYFKGSHDVRDNNKSGILIRCYGVLRNVAAEGWGGNGIYVFAYDGIGQASNCLLEQCSAEGNACSGLKIQGNDANVISVIGGDYSNNADWGVEDASGLGCYFSGIHMTANGGYLPGYCTHNGKKWLLRPNQDALGGSTTPGTNETVWTECFEGDAPYQPDPTQPGYTGWVFGKSYRCRGAFITHGSMARSVWDGCYTEGGQSGSFINYSAIVTGGCHGAGVYAYDMKSTGQPTFLDHKYGELNFRGNMKMNYLYFGLTRNRGDKVGMKMGAGPGIPIRYQDPEPVLGAINNDGWRPGDIIWNENRTATQAGVTPPLGWRCTTDDPPAYGAPFRFEEIPFPTAGGGSGSIPDNGVTTAKLADGSVTTAKLADNSVTNVKLTDMSQNTIKGRVSANMGDPEDLTGSQVVGLLPNFGALARGVVPASGGGSANFLRADGVWASPPAGNSSGNFTDTVTITTENSPLVINSWATQITLRSGGVTRGYLSSNATNSLEFKNSGGDIAFSVSQDGQTIRIPQLQATTASPANLVIDNLNGNRLLRSTSSRRYKQDIRPLGASEADKLLKVPAITYRSKSDSDDVTRVHWGLIAEDLDELGLKQLVAYNAEGKPDAVHYERLVVGLLDINKRFEARLRALEELGNNRKGVGASA